MLRKPILALSASDKVRDVITRAPVTRAVVDRFIPGATVAQAVDSIRGLRGEGLQVSLDYLGEGVTDAAGAAATVAAYLELLQMLTAQHLVAGAEVSVKLSAVGQALPDGEALALDNARTIVAAAYAAGARVTLDMEDHPTIDSTLRVLHALRVDQPDVGVAIQAMLHRTSHDLESLVGPGSRVRLVKGAYNEPVSVAHQDSAEVDLAYVRAIRQLMAGEGYPMIGSHDPRLVEIAVELASEYGRKAGDFEFQMLFGIRPDEQRRLVREGHTVRVYVPYGEDWYGYFTRRLAERPANLLFFLRSLASRT
ncbi:MAG: proline dehydrogenase family protein [Nakamurella sp.]